MAKLPEPIHEHSTATAIVRWYDKQDEQLRPHLGASELGKECKRAAWYGFRWSTIKKFDGRMKRLFNRGHREEPQFIEELRAIGVEVYDVDPDTKQQHRFVGYKGHLAGHCDAIGRGLPEAPKTWAIIEFKTHGEKSFKELVTKGVQAHKPEHYAQMQLYMGWSELDRALYLAVNKNTDELHSEWIHFDQAAFDKLNEKGAQIIDSDEPLEKLHQDPAWYQCKFCDHHPICHGDKVPEKNCRTCVHATPVDDGQWGCQHHERLIPIAEQRLGCRSHLYLPPLINYATPEDAGDGWIKYKHRDGSIFANVTEDCDRGEENMTRDITACFTSAELLVAIPEILGDKTIAEIQRQFPGSRVVSSKVTETAIEDDDIPF